MTFRQAQERGGKVRKGEHGVSVMKWGRYDRANESDDDGIGEKRKSFYLKGYRVFNAVQIEGIEFPTVPSAERLEPAQRIVRAGQIVAQMPRPPHIREGHTIHACYRRHSDSIEMPAFERFNTPEDFHLTLFHELIHATGHETRLARKGLIESDGFGGKVYSQEELVAEMGAAFLGMEANIVRDQHEQSAAYIKGWFDTLKEQDHRRWVVQAANQAGKAMDVHCSTCGEPWDTHHLWFDAIWDTGLSEIEIREWENLPQPEKLERKWREHFKTAGFQFGRTVINVIRCPACPKAAKPDLGMIHIKAAIEELLDGDEDGLAATFEDHGL